MPEEKRHFVVRLSNGKRLNLTIRKPTIQESELSDEEYTAVFNRSIMQGSPTRQKMYLQLKKKNLIDAEDNEKMMDLRNRVANIDSEIKKLAKRIDGKKEADFNEYDKGIDKEIKALQKKRAPLMSDFNDLRNANDSFFSRTADQQAENAQRNFLLACTTEYGPGNENAEEGDRVWESIDILNRETEGEKYQRSLYEYMMIIQDLPSDGDEMFNLTPETSNEEKKQGDEGSPEDLTDDEKDAAQPIDPRDPAASKNKPAETENAVVKM